MDYVLAILSFTATILAIVAGARKDRGDSKAGRRTSGITWVIAGVASMTLVVQLAKFTHEGRGRAAQMAEAMDALYVRAVSIGVAGAEIESTGIVLKQQPRRRDEIRPIAERRSREAQESLKSSRHSIDAHSAYWGSVLPVDMMTDARKLSDEVGRAIEHLQTNPISPELTSLGVKIQEAAAKVTLRLCRAATEGSHKLLNPMTYRPCSDSGQEWSSGQEAHEAIMKRRGL